ncbi:MAG: DUF6517 family protein [Haloarculaceae archaeon]
MTSLDTGGSDGEQPDRNGSDSSATDDPPGDGPVDSGFGFRINRRALLRATGAGALATSTWLAGCNQRETRRYEAAPVRLAPEATERGYALSESDTLEVSRTEEAGGLTLEMTIISHTAAYDVEGADYVESATAGLASTPAAEEAGVSLNPIATAPLRELLTRNVGREFLQQFDIGTTWEEGPEQVGSRSGTLLDTSVEFRTFAGIADDEFVLLHVARVEHEDDAVLVGEARKKPASDPRVQFVGDDSEVTRETVDETAARFAELLPLVVHGEAPGPSTPATEPPTETEEPTTVPNLAGFHAPGIDGIPYGESGEAVPEGLRSEWADAHAEQADLVAVGGDSAFEGRLFTKITGGDLYAGLYVPPEETERNGTVTPNTFSELRLQFDAAGSGELSTGDFRLTGIPRTPIGVGGEQVEAGTEDGSAGVQAVQIRLEEYRDGEFVDVTPDEPGEGDEGEPPPGAAMVGRPAEGGLGVEVQLNLQRERMRERLEEALDNGEEIDINYNIDIDFDGNRYGVNTEPQNSYDIYENLGNFGPPDLGDIPRENSSVSRIEVTQSVQDENNSLRLARDKETLARVFVDHPESSPITVDVNLAAYSCDGGCWTYVGNMSKTVQAPPTPLDREEYDDSVNFELPAAWRAKEHLKLRAFVSRPGHIQLRPRIRWRTLRVDFEQTFDPNITLIRVNEGTESSPNRPSTRASYLVQKGFERVMPIGGVFFHTPGAGMLGPISPSDNLRKQLDKLAQQIESSGRITIPIEQVFGLTQNYGGGLSDPTWGGGPGNCTAAWGELGSTSRELVMAHEVNHNIGGKEWAKHIAGGCGSGGGDSGNSSRDVGQVGWNPAYNSMVPTNHPELMTYCQDANPRKWIGEYRWDHLVDRWKNYSTGVPTHPDYQSSSNPSLRAPASKPTAAEQYDAGDPSAVADGGSFDPNEGDGSTDADADDATEAAADGATAEAGAADGDAPDALETTQTGTARVISGSLFPNGSSSPDSSDRIEDGELDPSFEVPGSTEEPGPGTDDPDAVLRVEYDSGVLEVGIDASFEPIERGQEVTESSFVVSVPDNGGISAVRLLDAETEEPLDEYAATDFELREAGVETPDRFARGELYDLDVRVEADVPGGVSLFRKLFYSPDGERLFPYGRQLTDDTAQVRFTEEPGGEAARFLLAVSDGVRTELAESDSFAVRPQPPRVEIDRANRWVGEYESDEGTEQESRDTDLGSDAEADPDLSAIRNVAGSVETVAGAAVSLRARGQTERWTALDGSDLRWTITDEDGDRVPIVGPAVGTRLLHRFDSPGRYTVTVTARDPETGLTATDEIDVVVETPALPDAELVEQFGGGGA